LDGIEVLYRATPMFTIGGEVEVEAEGSP